MRGHSEKLGIDFDDDICEISFDGFKWHLLLDYNAKIKVVKWMALGSLHRDDWVETDLEDAIERQVESEKTHASGYLESILSNRRTIDTKTIAGDYDMTVPAFIAFLSSHSLAYKEQWEPKDQVQVYFAMEEAGFSPLLDQ